MDYVKYIRSFTGHNKIILNAAGCIITKDSKILLQKRADDLKWGLFGGIMEIGETYQECAKREVFEETGLVVDLEYLVGIYHNFDASWPNNDKAHCICACFKANIKSGELKIDSESIEAKWFSLDELPEIGAIDHNQAIMDYKKGLKNQVK